MWCFWYRMLISHTLDKGTSPGRFVQRHLGRCGGCRSFYKQGLVLEERLREAAPAGGEAFGEYLRERVMKRLAERETGPVRPAVFGRPARWMGLAAGVLIVLGAGLFYGLRETPPPSSNPPGPTLGTAIRELSQEVELAVQRVQAEFHMVSVAAEYERLAADVQSAASFLSSCLPLKMSAEYMAPEEEVKAPAKRPETNSSAPNLKSWYFSRNYM